MDEANKNLEQTARDAIDERMCVSGWAVQHNKAIDFGVCLGVAVREYQTSVGPTDYAPFASKKALGVVKAQPDSWGARITKIEVQSGGYAATELKWVKNPEPLPFIYEATGVITRFSASLIRFVKFLSGSSEAREPALRPMDRFRETARPPTRPATTIASR